MWLWGWQCPPLSTTVCPMRPFLVSHLQPIRSPTSTNRGNPRHRQTLVISNNSLNSQSLVKGNLSHQQVLYAGEGGSAYTGGLSVAPLYRRQTPRTLPMYPILTSQGHTAPCGFLCALSVGVYSERNIYRNSIKGTQINLSVLCGDFFKMLFCDGH